MGNCQREKIRGISFWLENPSRTSTCGLITNWWCKVVREWEVNKGPAYPKIFYTKVIDNNTTCNYCAEINWETCGRFEKQVRH